MMNASILTLVTVTTVTTVAAGVGPGSTQPSAAQVELYRQAFPAAAAFSAKAIPPAMVAPSDRDNLTYYEAYDGQKQLLGYLRDFIGPVSPAEACPCNPLNLTLAFGPDKQLLTLVAPAPLQKYGHEAMTAGEQARLIELVRRPAEPLMQVRHVEDVVDTTTGATRLDLADAVVPRAGLSTRRIAGLVRETADILKGAPVGRDRQRLFDLLNQKIDNRAMGEQLARLIPDLETDELRQQGFYQMLNSYLSALPSDPNGIPGVEERLLSPSVRPELDATMTARACYELADRGLRLSFVDRCIASLSKSAKVNGDRVQLLRGTRRFAAGDLAGALAPLRSASRSISLASDPALHLRLGQALVAAHKDAEACPVAQRLYAEHPLMPGVKELLASCSGPAHPLEQVMAEANAKARERFIKGAQRNLPAIATLSLEADDGNPIDVALAQPKTITVALFFATWCPHCRVELPRIKDFVQALHGNQTLADQVRVIGVRTAVEKEGTPYPQFVQQMSPNFSIYADPTMSLAFSQFAKSVGVAAALPTTVVLDDKGTVRFLLEPGDWRDTQSELMWAVEALLPEVRPKDDAK